jgi:flagellar biosynthesis protein FliQ
LASLISPFSVNAKNLDVCRSCDSKACLKGTASQRGCELGLFVPKKSGNWNCTFCMDCARACPHDNVTVSSTGDIALATGRFWQRGDITALIFVFTFGALFNAFAMVQASQVLTLPGTAFLILLMVPTGFLMLSEVWNKLRALAPSTRLLAPALIPLGFSIWFGHYIFHFLTGALTFIPVLVSLWPGSDVDPMIWAGFPMGVPLPVVAPFQQGALGVGAIAGLFIAQRRARTFVHDRALAFAIPWHILIVGLSIFASWIFSLPMDMRGTFVGS